LKHDTGTIYKTAQARHGETASGQLRRGAPARRNMFEKERVSLVKAALQSLRCRYYDIEEM
jgi:hypothetical protein